MPPTSRRRHRDVDTEALSALSSSKPIERTPDVDPVLSASAPRVTSSTPSEAPASDLSPQGASSQRAGAKVRFGAAIDADVAEQVRDAVVHLGGDWTVARLLEEALEEKVARLAKQHGQPDGFPARASARLRVGRRIS